MADLPSDKAECGPPFTKVGFNVFSDRGHYRPVEQGEEQRTPNAGA